MNLQRLALGGLGEQGPNRRAATGAWRQAAGDGRHGLHHGLHQGLHHGIRAAGAGRNGWIGCVYDMYDMYMVPVCVYGTSLIVHSHDSGCLVISEHEPKKHNAFY